MKTITLKQAAKLAARIHNKAEQRRKEAKREYREEGWELADREYINMLNADARQFDCIAKNMRQRKFASIRRILTSMDSEPRDELYFIMAVVGF